MEVLNFIVLIMLYHQRHRDLFNVGILTVCDELKDNPKFRVVINYQYDTISILLLHQLYFNIGSVKDYLDMIVDYMNSYYNYDLEVKILPKSSGSYKEYDNYELHLDKDVNSISLEFFDLKN